MLACLRSGLTRVLPCDRSAALSEAPGGAAGKEHSVAGRTELEDEGEGETRWPLFWLH